MVFCVAGFAKKASQGGAQVMKDTHKSTSVPEAVSSLDKKSPRVRAETIAPRVSHKVASWLAAAWLLLLLP